ncbi:MAG: ABC transporter permease [Chitinispirillaceae bacterium]
MKILPISKIALYTAADEFRSRGFLVLTIVSVLALVLLRGCFSGEVIVNGEELEQADIGWHASFIAYHFISVAGMLMAVLISMRLFRRDKDSGMMVSALSAPVSRREYLVGKSLGVWALSTAFMAVLYLTVYLVVLINVGAGIPGFLPTALVSSLSVLFLVQMVLVLTLFASDILAALAGFVVIIVSFISDSFYMALRSDLARQFVENPDEIPVALWRIVWPKVAALQYYTVSLMQGETFHSMGPVHPVFNLLIYVVLFSLLLDWKFRREEITA